MIIDSESYAYKKEEPSERPKAGWGKLALLAAGSALAGGFAAAWWYRKTLKTLRQTGETSKNPNFGIVGNISHDED